MTVLTFLKAVLSVLVVLIFLRFLDWCLGLLNQPSDLAVVAGVVGVLLSFFTPYLVLKNIWRKKS